MFFFIVSSVFDFVLFQEVIFKQNLPKKTKEKAQNFLKAKQMKTNHNISFSN